MQRRLHHNFVRVEMLKDGASAIYGADAIGGVINFILLDEFRGVDASAQYSSPQHTGVAQGEAHEREGRGTAVRVPMLTTAIRIRHNHRELLREVAFARARASDGRAAVSGVITDRGWPCEAGAQDSASSGGGKGFRPAVVRALFSTRTRNQQ